MVNSLPMVEGQVEGQVGEVIDQRLQQAGLKHGDVGFMAAIRAGRYQWPGDADCRYSGQRRHLGRRRRRWAGWLLGSNCRRISSGVDGDRGTQASTVLKI